MKSVYSVLCRGLVLLSFSVILAPVAYAEDVSPVIQSNLNTVAQAAQVPVVVTPVSVPVMPTKEVISQDRSCSVNNPRTDRGTWVWDQSIAIDLAKGDKTKADELFAFALAHNIQTIYFNSYGFLTDVDKSSWKILSEFINTANEHCISVELLGGEDNWYQPKNILKATNFATQAVAFTQSLSDIDTKPTALHVNIELYTADGGKEWNSSITSRVTAANRFLNVLATQRVMLSGSGLKLSVDMPFWYDTTAGITAITRFNQTKPLAQYVIDLADVVNVLGYRDSAFGTQTAKGIFNIKKEDSSNGIYDLVKGEIAYASKKGKTVVVGVETKCFIDQALSILTFCGTRFIGTDKEKTLIKKGEAYMESELEKVLEAFEDNKAFGGFAIH